MSKQTGLADRARFDAFLLKWRGVVLKETTKWCDDDRARQLLTDAVIAEARRRYAYIDPPADMEYYFRAQVCLVYSITGENTRKLLRYYDEHALPEEEETAAPTPEVTAPAAAETPAQAPVAAESPAPAPAPVAVQSPAPAPAPVVVQPPAPAPAPVVVQSPAPAQAPVAAQPPAPAPVREAPPASAAAGNAGNQPPIVTPDTFYDPVRTSFWTPNSEKCEHVVREIEIPDEEDDEERSAVISFINTILFLFTAAAFGFCFYETGFLQYLLQ